MYLAQLDKGGEGPCCSGTEAGASTAGSTIKIDTLRMASSCKDIREDLIECVKRSDCMKAGDKSFHECVKDTASLDEKCKLLRTALYECRRGQVRSPIITKQGQAGLTPL